MDENQSIKDTLDVIRRALEEEEPIKLKKDYANVLILNKLVKSDGTINILKEAPLSKDDATDILIKKLDEVFDDHLINWLDKNIPDYLEKYFKKKDI